MDNWEWLAGTLSPDPVLAPFMTVVMVLILGVTAQVLAHRLALPGIIFLLVGGMLFGPSGLGLVQPQVFGDGLRSLVAMCVALIVFEGAMLIDLHHLRTASRALVGLMTVGALVTTGLTALLTWWLLETSWQVALLFGAIMSVTGPTVIQPILDRLTLPSRLKATLEGESVFLDAVGVLLAAAVFTAITAEGATALESTWQVARNLALGAAVGAGMGFAVFGLVKRLSPLPGPLIRLGVLTSALLTYGLAELIGHETGIMAVAMAGVVLGSLPLPYADTVKRLERDLTLMALSLVFILLAANVPTGELLALGWPGLLLVAMLMLLVRPLAVFLSTLGAGFSRSERVFMALLAPRGIVAASTATFFAIELQAEGVPGAPLLAQLVFLVVLVTVLIEGTGAPALARRLRLIPPKVFILGGDKYARQLAESQIEAGEAVQLVDENLDNVHMLMDRDLPVAHGRLADYRRLARLGARRAKRLVVATDDDDRNLQLGRLMTRHFPRTRVFVRLSDAAGESHRDACRQMGAEVWPHSEDKPMPLPLSVWNSAVQPEAVREARVDNEAVTEVPLKALSLPPGALLIGVKRNGRMVVPRGHTRLKAGDWVTIVGEAKAVEETVRQLQRA